jgi:Fe-S oxidoreductase
MRGRYKPPHTRPMIEISYLAHVRGKSSGTPEYLPVLFYRHQYMEQVMAIERLRVFEDDMKTCFRCSLCKMIPLPVITDTRYAEGCPANREYHVHGYSGSGKSIMALSLLEDRIKADKTLADITFACTTCGLCDVACKFIMDSQRQPVNIALREHLVDEGLELPAHRNVIDRLKHDGGADGAASLYRTWADDAGLKVMPGQKADVLLVPGLTHWDAAEAMEKSKRLARLLRVSGVDVGVLGEGPHDTGLFAYWTGHRDLFTDKAQKLGALINDLDVKAVVTTSGADLGMLRSKYPEYGVTLKPEVLHATEYLERLIAKRKLKLPRAVRARVTYHDPCYLGRQSEPPHEWQGELRMTHGVMTYYHPPKPINRGVTGVFEPPRRILEFIKGIDFVEMHRIREYAFCCGGGGGVPEAYPKLAGNTALHRIDEARSTGARYLVTACHHCRRNLSDAQSALPDAPLPVIDIIDLVYEAADIEK